MQRLYSFFICLGILLGAQPAAAGPKVMASIVPIHAIVAAVMKGQGEPELVFRGQMSEHASGLSPAQILRLGEADAVFMAAPFVEVKLGALSGSEAVNGKAFTLLAEAPGVSRLPLRAGGAWEEDEGDDHDHGGAYNGHVWLDPENAKAMAAAIAAELGRRDPAHAADYAANAAAFTAATERTAAEIDTLLAPVRDKPFIVFHDAYPYFEKRFGLQAVGSIADAGATAPSARRIADIRARLAEAGALCVFREPQFDSRFADVVTEGTGVRSGVLDAVGADLAPGPDAYPKLLLALAGSLKSCLGQD